MASLDNSQFIVTASGLKPAGKTTVYTAGRSNIDHVDPNHCGRGIVFAVLAGIVLYAVAVAVIIAAVSGVISLGLFFK